VLIVNGAQQGLALAMMAMLKPGDVLAVDALTYPGIKALAVAHRIELLPIPLADGKTHLDALAASCKRRPVRAFYAMPTLHNPLGSIMPAADRKRLVALAEEHDFALIEDSHRIARSTFPAFPKASPRACGSDSSQRLYRSSLRSSKPCEPPHGVRHRSPSNWGVAGSKKAWWMTWKN
jgi:DNA-binding transcriptional MocR family regulator